MDRPALSKRLLHAAAPLLASSHLAFSIIVVSAAISAPAYSQSDSLEVAVGETTTLSLDDLAESINLSDAGIVEVAKGRNKATILITGKLAGETTVTVRLKSGKTETYRAIVSDPAAFQKRLALIKSNLSSQPGLSVVQKGGKIFVSGKVKTRGSLQALATVKAQFPGLIVDATDKDLPEANSVITTINRVLSENDISNIQSHAYGKIYVLEGTPKNKSERELALRIARMIQPEVEDRMSEGGSAAPSVSIEVMFVEVEKKNDLKFGLKGTEMVNGVQTPKSYNGLAKGSLNPTTGSRGKLNWQVGPLTAFLELIQTTSSSRVLSNPQLVARSGTNAEFHSGGTFFLETTKVQDGNRETTLHEVKYGIELNILPLLDRLGQIDAKIETKVSDLGAPKYAENLPSLTIASVKTAVTIRDGQSILLSGLVNKKNRKTVERVPLLADIPVIGELFKSRKFDDEEVELLILVTINRVAGSEGNNPAGQKLWNKSSRDVEFSVFD
jgi:pilus assembly protein CpaC